VDTEPGSAATGVGARLMRTGNGDGARVPGVLPAGDTRDAGVVTPTGGGTTGTRLALAGLAAAGFAGRGCFAGWPGSGAFSGMAGATALVRRVPGALRGVGDVSATASRRCADFGACLDDSVSVGLVVGTV
jgi:hypothetical protein